MRIGQIVFITNVSYLRANVQTGIITKKEQEDSGTWWYEVLCNDGQNHVLPGYLLSSVGLPNKIKNEKTIIKCIKNCASLYKYNTQPVKLYT